ncbi:MAG TPA: LysM peptidoglycan-binding domain-containing protein [Candidatus Pacearchaeota archaeon]|nr:LysM peptidoglycan-binding domain-containing protein [Candidatus Pacearchaeota archaeon]HOL90553.1 LysM peptidoglycan-binding domain-containing protein [Candidatus Pacearchaeota archaeon]HPO68140.1 LysM peptidoglycan-binding domain-containing protein [Candidatus Pacearchaeota archaeon]
MEYSVKEGDTFTSISQKFNISIDTILWANNLNKNSKLKEGQTLIILPVSGVLYYVKKGDTLNEIAKKYSGDIQEIISFNNLESEDIYIGDILIIPNGKIPTPVKTNKQYVQSSTVIYNKIPVGSSYFICPTSSCKISQYLHWHNAIDFSEKCGNYVLASAGGTVLRRGWDNTGGNYITILHPNDVVTYYGHLSSFLVKPGDSVSQGTPIGSIGRTGVATGCHVHFEVRGANNPFNK